MRTIEKIFNIPCNFGLEGQGHIQTVEQMLQENKTWMEIGEQIGWCHKTAKQHYMMYLVSKKSKTS